MALTVRDMLQLQSLQSFQLIAGQDGLSNHVTSAGIGDYEFCSDIDYPQENAFEKDSLVFSSLLFAKDNPEMLLPAVRRLYESGVAGFAYKTVIYDELPEDVVRFCNENDFPLFSFGIDTYFENIVFEIMNAVRSDDTTLLSESTIRKMIDANLPKTQVYFLSKNISLRFKEYVMGVFLCSDTCDKENTFYTNSDRYLKNIYLHRSLNDKVILSRYENGLFALLTARSDDKRAFEMILGELLDFIGIDAQKISVSRSSVHKPYDELDFCFRESYHTHLASLAEGRSFSSYELIGTYQFLIPQKDTAAMRQFCDRIIKPLQSKQEYFETVMQLTRCGGDTQAAADFFGCHQNTIRYRLGKIKALLSLESETEQDFYAVLAAAMRLYMLQTQM